MSEPSRPPLLDLRGVRKEYGGLRPLRIQALRLHEAQHLALVGFDGPSAEIFVNLVTGASVPDAGEVRVFGESTAAIADADAWLASLDRFGILSERAVLLEGLNALQNLAMPHTLDLEPLSDPLRAAATTLAIEVGLSPGELARPVAELAPASRLRVRLGRALALDPRVLIAEHPNAALPAADVPIFAADYGKLVAARRLAAVTLTADRTFAAAVSEEVLTLQAATGELKAAAGWRRWLAGR